MTKGFTGNWTGPTLTAPQYLTGLSAALSCAFTDSFVRVDSGITTQGNTGDQPAFTLLSAAIDSEDWSEMLPYVKTDVLRNSIPGIWSARSNGAAPNETRHTSTSLLFKPGLSAVKVQVGYRFRSGKVFQINGARSNASNAGGADDANGISFISLQEVPDNGFVTIEIED